MRDGELVGVGERFLILLPRLKIFPIIPVLVIMNLNNLLYELEGLLVEHRLDLVLLDFVPLRVHQLRLGKVRLPA